MNIHHVPQTVPKRTSTWIAQSLKGLGARSDFLRCLQDICRAAGAKHGSFVMRHVPGVVIDDPLQLDTFGEAWRAHAEEQKYSTVDPVKICDECVTTPLDWGDMPRGRMRAKRFFKDFNDFQLGRQALTSSFRGPSGDRSLLTLTSDASEKRWAVVKHDLQASLAVIHPALHRTILRVKFQIDEVVVARLTPREKECLVWAAHGYTSKKIGLELGLTPATVNFFIESAVAKLSTTNRAHAAAKAVALGIIAPPR